jgi:hypothetical protein
MFKKDFLGLRMKIKKLLFVYQQVKTIENDSHLNSRLEKLEQFKIFHFVFSFSKMTQLTRM